MKKKTIIYIDPQSSGNLAAYDHGVLSAIDGMVYYACSRYYDYETMPDNVIPCPLFSYNRISNTLLKALSYLFSLIRLFFLVLAKKPQVIHIQWFRIPVVDYYYYKFLKLCSSAKIIYTAHNVLPHNTGNRYSNVFRKTYRMANAIIVHSANTKKEIAETFGINNGKINVIRHGTLKMKYDEGRMQAERKTLEDKYPTNGKLVFTSLGEQSAYKGIDLLAEVWMTTPELRDNSNVMLILAGKGVGIDLTPLKQCANVKVEDSRLTNEEYMFLLRRTDVYMLPYRKISQSGALFTAMTEHIPLLVSDAGGLSEPLDMANIGWKVKAGDKESLRQQLIYIANHNEDIAKIKDDSDSWERLCDAYGWTEISHKTSVLYNRF